MNLKAARLVVKVPQKHDRFLKKYHNDVLRILNGTFLKTPNCA
jgi:hypothetical protein